jgi:hypothetical protein
LGHALAYGGGLLSNFVVKECGFTTLCMITSYEVYFYFWDGFGLGETKLYQGVLAIWEGVGCNG